MIFVPRLCKTKVRLSSLNPLSWTIWPSSVSPLSYNNFCLWINSYNLSQRFLIIKCWRTLQYCLLLITFVLSHFVLFYSPATFIFFLTLLLLWVSSFQMLPDLSVQCLQPTILFGYPLLFTNTLALTSRLVSLLHSSQLCLAGYSRTPAGSQI